LKPAKKVRNEQDQAVNNRIDAEIDRILATEEELIPTSGFMASVMERVEEEAAVPPPIPFPWKRAVPGILLAAGVFGWGAVRLIRTGLPALASLTLPAPHLSAAYVRPVESAGWVALALGVSLVSWLLSRRLAGRGGLL
jgi:hypothetical protein